MLLRAFIGVPSSLKLSTSFLKPCNYPVQPQSQALFKTLHISPRRGRNTLSMLDRSYQALQFPSKRQSPKKTLQALPLLKPMRKRSRTQKEAPSAKETA